MRAEDTRAALELLVIGLTVAAGVVAVPHLRAAVDTLPLAAPRTAAIACPPPTEPEKLLVVVRVREGRLISECLYAGSGGTTTRRTAVRQAAR